MTEAYNNLGIIFAEQGLFERAVEVTKQGIRVAPEQITLDGFLTLWRDADPDTPILKQAKAEYAKLQ